MSGESTVEAFAAMVEEVMCKNTYNVTTREAHGKMRALYSDTVSFRAGDYDLDNGSFEEVLIACREIWRGYRCSGPRHNVTLLEDGKVQLSQEIEHVEGVDIRGNLVESTEYDGEFSVTHVFSMSADGKICGWEQDFDEEFMYISRARIDTQNEEIEISPCAAA